MSSNQHYRLIIRRGPQPNQVFELTKQVITIGRDIINDITISDPEVSRQHCQLVKSAEGYTLTDNDSTNGSFINGERVTGSRLLQNGDTIGFGETVIVSYTVTTALTARSAAEKTPTEPKKQADIAAAKGDTQQVAAAEVAEPAEAEADVGADTETRPPDPPPAYVMNPPAEPVATPEARRVLLFGCGVLVALCLISTFMGAILIDASGRWGDVPLVGNALAGAPVPMSRYETRHLTLDAPRDWHYGLMDSQNLSLVAASPDTLGDLQLRQFLALNFSEPATAASLLYMQTDGRTATEIDLLDALTQDDLEVLLDEFGFRLVDEQNATTREIDGQRGRVYRVRVAGLNTSLEQHLTIVVVPSRDYALLFLSIASPDDEDTTAIFDHMLDSIRLKDVD